jgi:hypothetical protein
MSGSGNCESSEERLMGNESGVCSEVCCWCSGWSVWYLGCSFNCVEGDKRYQLCEFVLCARIALFIGIHLGACRVSCEGSCIRGVVLYYVSFGVQMCGLGCFSVLILSWRWGEGFVSLIGCGVCGGVFGLLIGSCIRFHIVWGYFYQKLVYRWASGGL